MKLTIRSSEITGLVLALIVGWGFCHDVAFAQSAASLKGVLKDEAGKPLTNANVIAVPTVLPAAVTASKGLAPGSASPILSASTGTEVRGKTDDQGNFSLAGIPPAKYTLCVQDQDNKHLDPCFWSTGTSLDLSNGKDVANNQALVTSAATLQVRVDDPLHLSDPRAGEFETLVAVILPNGRLAPMNLVTSESTGKTFQLAVPVGEHKVLVKSNYFTIADGAGHPLEDIDAGSGHKFPPTVNAPVSIAAGMSYVTVTITGKR